MCASCQYRLEVEAGLATQQENKLILQTARNNPDAVDREAEITTCQNNITQAATRIRNGLQNMMSTPCGPGQQICGRCIVVLRKYVQVNLR
jgi:hypothetical protein